MTLSGALGVYIRYREISLQFLLRLDTVHLGDKLGRSSDLWGCWKFLDSSIMLRFSDDVSVVVFEDGVQKSEQLTRA